MAQQPKPPTPTTISKDRPWAVEVKYPGTRGWVAVCACADQYEANAQADVARERIMTDTQIRVRNVFFSEGNGQ